MSDYKTITEIRNDLLVDDEDELNFLSAYCFASVSNPRKEDLQTAKEYLQKCIERNYEPVYSRFYLCNYLLTDEINNETVNDDRIVKHYEWILEHRDLCQNDLDDLIIYYLGKVYALGLGIEKDFKKAFEYFLKGTKETHFANSYIGLGNCYLNGWYVEKDCNIAFDLFQKALDVSYRYPNCITNYESSRAFALLMIGKCYAYGYGVERNIDKAIEYFNGADDTYANIKNTFDNDKSTDDYLHILNK